MYNVYVFEQISPFPLPFYQLLSPGCFSCGLPIGSNDWVAGPGWLTSKDADSTLVSFVLLYHSLLCVLAAKKKSQRVMILLETFHDLAPELALLLPFFPWDLIQQENPWWSDWIWFIVSSSQKQMLVQSQRTKSTGGSGCLSDKVLPFR